MKNKFIKLVFVAFALITQLSPLKAQTQEIDHIRLKSSPKML